MHAFEGAQKIPHIRPHAFGGVAMDFANPVVVIIARIFKDAIFGRRVGTEDVIATIRFIRINYRFGACELMELCLQRFAKLIKK